MMDKHELERRTKEFAVSVIRFVGSFRESAAGRVIGNQLLKSGTSIGANYREANRAVSRKEFIHKITIAEKEAAETSYWLEICSEIPLGNQPACNELSTEAGELLAIFTSIGRSVRKNDRNNDRTKVPRVSETEYPSYVLEEFDDDVTELLPSTLKVDDAQ